jgi:hypothetical protein
MLLAGIGAALAGCATPAPIVKLDPIADNVLWTSGRPFVGLDDRGVRVAAAFNRQVGATLSVRVEVENRTDRPLEIDPGQQFSFLTCKGPAETSCGKELLVIDPEEMLAHYDEAASREQAQAIDDERASGSLVLLGAFSDVASLAGRHGGDAPLRTEAAEDQMHNGAADHDRALDGIADQREMWSNMALRRHTLLPGASVGGQVFIPGDGAGQDVWLKIRVGTRTFPFHFHEVARQVPRQG